MARLQPELRFSVDDHLQAKDEEGEEGEGKKEQFAVHLKFNKMEDFEPARVAEQVPQLKELLEVREKLRRLQTRVEMDPNLENSIEELIQSTEMQEKLSAERPKGSSGEAPQGEETGGDKQ